MPGFKCNCLAFKFNVLYHPYASGLEGSSEEAGNGEALVRGISQALGGVTVVRKVRGCTS